MNLNKLKQNKYKLYGYWFFHNLILAYVIELLYWEERGIRLHEVIYIEIIYASIVSALEIPTGYLADRWSRKGMMILGAICSCLEFGILIVANSFLDYALAVGIAAIGKAVTSGTSNALLYDSMKFTHEEEKFEKVLGKLNFLDGFASAIAALLGGIVAVTFGLISNYYLSFFSTIIALFISLTLVEPNVKTNKEKDNQNYNSIKDTIIFLKQNLSVLFVIINGIIIASTLIYVDEFWQIYLRDIHFPILFFGVVSLLINLNRSVGSLLTDQLIKKVGYKGSMMIVFIVYTIGLIGLSLIQNYMGIIFLLVIYIPTGLMGTLVNGYIHHHADSHFRATAESFSSFFHRIVSIVLGLIFGVIATSYNVNRGFLFLALFIMVFSLIYIVKFKKKIIEI